MKTLLLAILVLTQSYTYSADRVKQGEIVPYDGVLLTDEQFIDAANAKQRVRLSDLKITQLEALSDLHEARHKVYQEELSKANSRANMAEFKTGIGMVLAFTLGAVITGFVAKETLK
jgi:hypothetical protein